MCQIEYLPEVQDDMKALDGSQRKAVQMALAKLRRQPTEYGKPLGHKHGRNLTGLRRIKLSALGIRVVYLPIAQRETVLVLAVGKREDDKVYREVQRRYSKV
ncbi:MAG: type II toxin-antitoxin system RelE/ParE family toxin [Oscillospiraceae bacterium]|nr:type II toxin-antitoxin system RelE/ParE family toxin [Oscillospiraceae bacterium]